MTPWIGGTWRRVGRVYGEHVYGGKGAPLAAGAREPVGYVDYRRPAAPTVVGAEDTAP